MRAVYAICVLLGCIGAEVGFAQDRYELAGGDIFKISVLGREDLSGDHSVGADGVASIHLIGPIVAAGRTATELEANIARMMSVQLGGPTSVTVQIVKYRPVFVTGGVRSPGSYQYSPDMTVLKLIALAGGYHRLLEAAQPALALRAADETKKIVEARASIAASLAQRARVLSEKEGGKKIADEPAIAGLIGSEGASTLIATEAAVLEATRRASAAFEEAQRIQQALSKEEAVALARQAEVIDREIAEAEKEAALQSQLLQSGLAQRFRAVDRRRELAEFRSLRFENAAFDARARRTAAEADASIIRSRRARELAIAETLNEIDRKLRDDQVALNASIQTLKLLTGLDAHAASLSKTVYSEILRERNGELKAIPAALHDRLSPGDVLRVESPEILIPESIAGGLPSLATVTR